MIEVFGVIVYICYVFDLNQFVVFEWYVQEWICLVFCFGGVYYGYFLLLEGVNNVVYVFFFFLLLVVYECYCIEVEDDVECNVVYEFVQSSGCIFSYECIFLCFVFELLVQCEIVVCFFGEDCRRLG